MHRHQQSPNQVLEWRWVYASLPLYTHTYHTVLESQVQTNVSLGPAVETTTIEGRILLMMGTRMSCRSRWNSFRVLSRSSLVRRTLTFSSFFLRLKTGDNGSVGTRSIVATNRTGLLFFLMEPAAYLFNLLLAGHGLKFGIMHHHFLPFCFLHHRPLVFLLPPPPPLSVVQHF